MMIEKGSVERLKRKSGKKKKKKGAKTSQPDVMVHRQLSEKVEYRSVFARGLPR